MLRLALLALPLLLLATPAWAEPASSLHGEWVFDEASGSREGRAAAIETTCEGFPKLFRGLVRKKLTDAVPIREHYSIQIEADRAHIVTEANAAGWISDLSWSPVEGKTEKGEMVTLRRKVVGDALHTRVDAENGWTTHRFSVQGDRMTIQVVVSNDRLPSPLEYSLVYRRK
jgi:hypothetical protein